MEAGASAEGAKPRLTAATPAGVGHLVLACSALTWEGELGGQLVGGSRGAEAVPNTRRQRQGRRLQEVRGQGSWVLQRDRQASEHG